MDWSAVLFFLCFLFAALALITLLPIDHWIVRLFDFPKVQLFVVSSILFIIALFFLDIENIISVAANLTLFLALCFNCYRILPYTMAYSPEVLLTNNSNKLNSISIMASNVLKENSDYDKLLTTVKKYQLDLLLTLETDKKWGTALSVLEENYPFSQKIPQDNFYGMHFYSRIPVKDMEVRYLIKNDIPSICCLVQLRNKNWIRIYGLHPKPPSPTEAPTSTKRDAELLMVAKEVQKENRPTLVFGDLNDVAWSRTTILFRKISGLLDPRIGRGRFCTFHANYRILRWPLDHLFNSKEFCLRKIKVLPHIGSDHLPIYARLQLSDVASDTQTEPEANQQEKELAEEKIDKGES